MPLTVENDGKDNSEQGGNGNDAFTHDSHAARSIERCAEY